MATQRCLTCSVTTDWVAQHATDAGVRVVEVDVDTTAYDQGHVPGAAGWNWTTELCDTLVRDIVPMQEARGAARQDRHRQQDDDRAVRRQQQLVCRLGVLAAEDLRPRGRADHGRRPQEMAGRRPRSEHRQAVVPGEDLQGQAPDMSLRAFLPEVQQAVAGKKSRALVDVRSPQEFTGEILAPPGLPETCQRGGHIPGAKSIPWGKNCNDDGTFKSFDELKALYAAQGITGDKPVIAYCRIGERSSLTWFAMKYLLGFKNVQELRRLVDRVGQPGRRAGGETSRTEAVEARRLLAAAAGAGGLADERSRPTSSATSITARSPTSTPARGSRAPTARRSEEAESRAIEKATRYLQQTRKFEV